MSISLVVAGPCDFCCAGTVEQNEQASGQQVDQACHLRACIVLVNVPLALKLVQCLLILKAGVRRCAASMAYMDQHALVGAAVMVAHCQVSDVVDVAAL